MQKGASKMIVKETSEMTMMNWNMHRHNPVRKCIETEDVNPMTRLLADAPANPDDESNRRRSWTREIIVSVETHRGSHIRETKCVTQKTDVFGTKYIRTKTLPRGNPSIIPDLCTVLGFTPSQSQGPKW